MIPRFRFGAAGCQFTFAGDPSHGPELIRKSGHRQNDNYLQFAHTAARSAELCAAHLRAKHLGISRVASNSPAPVETDRRPENATRTPRFAVGHCSCSPVASLTPSEGRRDTAEGELINSKATSGRKLGVS
jgi:hypothetical protein